MRKKIRKIVVEGAAYAWAVEELDWPSFVLRVWRSRCDLWFEKKFGPENSLTPVTPRAVAVEIQARLVMQDRRSPGRLGMKAIKRNEK